jgi:hypothetical protein
MSRNAARSLSEKPASIESSNSATASSHAASTRRPFGVIVAGSVLRWFGCGFRLMRPFRSSAWMTSLMDCGVMNARRASCDVESGAPCRLSTLSVVNWSVVRPYGATRSLMLANSR